MSLPIHLVTNKGEHAPYRDESIPADVELVSSVSGASTDQQVPTAKALHDSAAVARPGFKFQWLTSTADTDPGAGKFKLVPGSPNKLYISETDGDGVSLAAYFASRLATGVYVTWRSRDDQTKVRAYLMQTASDEGSYWTVVHGSPLISNGAFADLEEVTLTFEGWSDPMFQPQP